ncbi:hypothetical protein Gpo141_00010606 [Globisporangium polare]
MHWRTAGVVLALRPLASVFTPAELVLMVLLALLYDQCRLAGENDAAEATRELQCRQPAPQQASQMTAPQVSAAAATTTPATVVSKAIRSDLIGDGKVAPTVGMDVKLSPHRDAKVRDESYSCAATDDESIDSCSTSDTCELSSLSTPLARRDKRVRMSDHDFSDVLLNSMAMSRCSSEIAPSFEFMHQSGELQIRGDTVLDVFKPWRRCSILLSVMTGELFVHRKAKTHPQVFSLACFTGAAIHSKRRHSFKVMFDGHPPLYFRATTTQDAEHWVKALEYAKETTWRLWS